MSHHDEGPSVLLGDAAEQCEHLATCLRIQRARGLVRQKKGCVTREGASDGHALPFPDGEFVGTRTESVPEADPIQHLLRTRPEPSATSRAESSPRP